MSVNRIDLIDLRALVVFSILLFLYEDFLLALLLASGDAPIQIPTSSGSPDSSRNSDTGSESERNRNTTKGNQMLEELGAMPIDLGEELMNISIRDMKSGLQSDRRSSIGLAKPVETKPLEILVTPNFGPPPSPKPEPPSINSTPLKVHASPSAVGV